ncbi:hypothetical protein BUALT_Bualt15G0105800 [Buddleja alternifolia]|uniref:Uncharacterized protein n=1 Tax=Buddleja alternifolia TaxID=168488 RepID=A0AAV6WPT8_9LAMI|nr:hypothetical protein BUALT_Bualt15G0105800 [Buddleja alternifolia]
MRNGSKKKGSKTMTFGPTCSRRSLVCDWFWIVQSELWEMGPVAIGRARYFGAKFAGLDWILRWRLSSLCLRSRRDSRKSSGDDLVRGLFVEIPPRLKICSLDLCLEEFLVEDRVPDPPSQPEKTGIQRYARVPSQSIVIHMLSLLVRVWGKAGLGGAREPLACLLGRRTAGSSHVVSEPTLLRASHCGRRETPVWCSIKGLAISSSAVGIGSDQGESTCEDAAAGKAGLGGAREPLACLLGRRTAGSSHVVSEPTLLRASHCGRRETPVWCSIKGGSEVGLFSSVEALPSRRALWESGAIRGNRHAKMQRRGGRSTEELMLRGHRVKVGVEAVCAWCTAGCAMCTKSEPVHPGDGAAVQSSELKYARVPSQSIVIHMLSLLVRVWGKAGLGGAREPLACLLGRRTAGSSQLAVLEFMLKKYAGSYVVFRTKTDAGSKRVLALCELGWVFWAALVGLDFLDRPTWAETYRSPQGLKFLDCPTWAETLGLAGLNLLNHPTWADIWIALVDLLADPLSDKAADNSAVHPKVMNDSSELLQLGWNSLIAPPGLELMDCPTWAETLGSSHLR